MLLLLQDDDSHQLSSKRGWRPLFRKRSTTDLIVMKIKKINKKQMEGRVQTANHSCSAGRCRTSGTRNSLVRRSVGRDVETGAQKIGTTTDKNDESYVIQRRTIGGGFSTLRPKSVAATTRRLFRAAAAKRNEVIMTTIVVTRLVSV